MARSTRSILVVHHALPGPWSPSPRDRQVARRLADVVALGFEVSLAVLEPAVGAGAPRWLDSFGIATTGRVATPSDIAGHVGAVWLTSLAVPGWVADAAGEREGALILDLDAVPSAGTGRSAAEWGRSERPGVATLQAAERARDTRLVERSDLVIAAWPHVAADVADLCATATIALVPPTIEHPAPRSLSDRRGIAVPGLWSIETRTPDATAAQCLLASLDTLRLRSAEVTTIGEDAVPSLRASTRHRTTQARRDDCLSALFGARLAWCARPEGEPVPARLAELAAMGLPFVASTRAIGDLDLGRAAPLVSAATHADQLDLANRLLHDDDAWWEASDRLRDSAAPFAADRARPALATALRGVDLDAAHDDSLPAAMGAATPDAARPLRATDANIARGARAPEAAAARLGGTLAAADERIERLESLAIPRHLLDREAAFHTQRVTDHDGRWRQLHATHFDNDRWRVAVERYRPDAAFSILLPTWNTPADTLTAAIESVVAQTYDRWELCIVDDGSTSPETLAVLDRFESLDPARIRVRRNMANGGISAASNDALAMARHRWVALFDHDDLLAPDALAWVASYVAACPEIDLWYSDEDKIDEHGVRRTPFSKPDWSPDLLLAVNYVCHLLVTRRDLARDVGGFRSRFDGAQDWDLVLRLTEATDAIGHISRPLYSWRMIAGSTAADIGAKPAAHLAGQAAVREAIERRGLDAAVVDGALPTTHRVRPCVPEGIRISILIPTRDRVDLLRSCIDSVRGNNGGFDLEIIVVDNDSTDPATLGYLAELDRLPGHRVVRYPHEFSFARQMNLGALEATGELFLLLNNDTTIRTPDWLRSMAELALRPEVGMVGSKLMFPPDARDGRPQHEGIVLGMGGLAYNVDLGGYLGLDHHVRNTAGVTAACAMFRTSVFFEVGGMEERFRVAFNDVDLGIRIGEHGYRILYTPFAVLEHPESASRKDLHPAPDEAFFIERWGTKGAIRDPFISPHFEWMEPLFYRL